MRKIEEILPSIDTELKEGKNEVGDLTNQVSTNQSENNDTEIVQSEIDNTEIILKENRQNLVKELEGDIKIEDDSEELDKINQQEKDWLEQSGGLNEEVSVNTPLTENTNQQISIIDNENEVKNSIQIPPSNKPQNNIRKIETDISEENKIFSHSNSISPDNLPILEPVRTLQSDSENKDDIISKKLGGATINTPKINTEANSEQQKPIGPDPYREPIE